MSKSEYTSRGRSRHSYIHFYPENWLAGVAGLPRIVWSVYFDICLYNWDKARAMPESLLRMTTSDLGAEQSGEIVEMLLSGGKVQQDEDGNFFSPRAIEEAERAFRVWDAKVQGGSRKKRDTSISPERYLKESSRTLPKGKTLQGEQEDTPKTPETHPRRVLEDTSKIPQGEQEDTSDSEESSKTPRRVLDRTKNQEPTYKKEEASDDASSKKQQQDFSGDEVSAVEAKARITAAEAEASQIRQGRERGMVLVSEAWNTVARKHGWSQISKMTEQRCEKLGKRIDEHGANRIAGAIRTIPESDYLMGRTDHKVTKPSFDWMIGEDACAKLVEGFYNRPDPDKPKPETLEMQDLRQRKLVNFRSHEAKEIGFEEFNRRRDELAAEEAELRKRETAEASD